MATRFPSRRRLLEVIGFWPWEDIPAKVSAWSGIAEDRVAEFVPSIAMEYINLTGRSCAGVALEHCVEAYVTFHSCLQTQPAICRRRLLSYEPRARFSSCLRTESP